MSGKLLTSMIGAQVTFRRLLFDGGGDHLDMDSGVIVSANVCDGVPVYSVLVERTKKVSGPVQAGNFERVALKKEQGS